MKSLVEKCRRFIRSEEAPTATEYAVMLALIIVVAVGAVTFLGQEVSEKMSDVGSALDEAGN